MHEISGVLPTLAADFDTSLLERANHHNEKAAKRAVDAVVESVRESLQRRGVENVTVESVVTLTSDSAHEVLLSLFSARSADMLVVGSRGRGALKSTLLGSTAHHLVNAARAPVLVVPIVDALLADDWNK